MPEYDREESDQLDLKNGKSSLSAMSTTEFFGKWAKAHDSYATNLDELEEFEKTKEGREILKSLGLNKEEE